MALNDMEFCRNAKIALPSVYADALSYYEIICLLAKKVEDLQTQINLYSDEYKQYTDSAVNSLRVELQNELQQTVIELQNQYVNFTKSVNNTLSLFQIQLNALDNKIDVKEVAINERTNLMIERNNKYIFDKIESELIGIKVINFFTGEKVTVQSMFDYLATFHLDNSISYAELVNRNITYSNLSGLNIDYTHLVTQGATLII